MRTGWVGRPDARARDAEKVCVEALEETIAAIKAGKRVADVDAISRQIIGKSGLGLMQMTRSAYSIGIAFAPDWGEGGLISFHPREERPLQANMVFHVIPWGLVPGEFAVGFSETVRVTEDGCEVLTNLPRRLFVEPDKPVVQLPPPHPKTNGPGRQDSSAGRKPPAQQGARTDKAPREKPAKGKANEIPKRSDGSRAPVGGKVSSSKHHAAAAKGTNGRAAGSMKATPKSQTTKRTAGKPENGKSSPAGAPRNGHGAEQKRTPRT